LSSRNLLKFPLDDQELLSPTI
jgi:predicted kinase